jgi:hypothetical protein
MRAEPANGVVRITGSPTDPVTVTLEIAKRKARKLGLYSRVIVEATGELNADGAVLLPLKPEQAVLDQLAKGSGKLPATVLAESGGSSASASVTLTLQPKVKAVNRKSAHRRKH